jgi:hypothetical protein
MAGDTPVGYTSDGQPIYAIVPFPACSDPSICPCAKLVEPAALPIGSTDTTPLAPAQPVPIAPAAAGLSLPNILLELKSWFDPSNSIQQTIQAWLSRLANALKITVQVAEYLVAALLLVAVALLWNFRKAAA